MADLEAAGKALVDQFVAKLPEALRGSAAEMFSKPEAQEAIKFAGEAALMRSDYSRNQDQVAQEAARVATDKARVEKWHSDLAAWHQANKDRLALGEEAAKAGWTPDTPNPNPLQTPKPADLPADLVRSADLDAREQTAVDYIEASADLRFKHFQTFGEILNVRELIKDPRVRELGIQGVYDARYKDRLDAKAKDSRDAEWAKREAEIRADERKKIGNRPLTPVGGDLSPLDALESPDKKPGTASVEDMAAEYERLVSAKAG
jgi:hypothetical protein